MSLSGTVGVVKGAAEGVVVVGGEAGAAAGGAVLEAEEAEGDSLLHVPDHSWAPTSCN